MERSFQLVLTERDVDLLLKSLDTATTRGIETSRRAVALYDKISHAVRTQMAKPPAPLEPPTPGQNGDAAPTID